MASKKEKPKTIAGKVREAAQQLKEFGRSDLINYDYGCYISRSQLTHTFMDFRKSGEIEQIEDGKYRYVHKKKKRTKADIIWHLVRSRRQFSTDEIEMLSKAARATVLEYLNCLKRLGYIKRVKWGHWQLIDDPGPETPVNTAKCNRLKRLRRKKKT